jgi:CheY-like chemotaxis protein
MKLSTRSLYTLTLILVVVIASLQVWNTSSLFNNQSTISHGKTSRLTTETQELIAQLEALLNEPYQCPNSASGCSPKSAQIEMLEQQLSNFTDIASEEKSNISLVGAIEYTEFKVALNKFQATKNQDDFHHSLLEMYTTLQGTYQDLTRIHVTSNNDMHNQSLKISLLLFTFLCVVTILCNWIYNKKIKNFAREYYVQNRQFDLFANNINNLDTHTLAEKISHLDLPQSERKIYANLLELHKKNELEKQNSDLYQQLYTLIGYEIRGITNTIEGGVRLLVQDTDENGAVMAKEISSATNTLSELADNYNRLITQGNNKQSHSSVAALISELVVHLKAKVQRNQIKIDCFIENNLPNTIDTNSTGLFWVLFLQFSNALLTVDSKRILLHVYTTSSLDIEKSRLVFELVYFDSDEISLSELVDAKWNVEADKLNSQDAWSKEILNNVSFYKSSWLTSGSLHKKKIEIDVTPINFMHVGNELKNKHIMVCADSKLQIDIIQNLLTRYQCKVSIARTPNDVFKNLSKITAIDAVIVTDTIKGIELRSFCKTLKSRMKNSANTQLLLAISKASSVRSVHEFVDRIFYTPLLPHEFIPNLVDAIKNDDKEKGQDQSNFLIVEDDRVQQFLLQQLLKKLGYEANTASSGEDAVEFFKNNNVDIIFMDCIMPGMGGLDATNLIRTHEKEQSISLPTTIIGSTALTSASEHKACIDAGMDYVISKPYKSDEIAKVIKKYLAVQKIY